MNVNSPEYRHMMAQIPLELIHKTQAAKEIQMNVVENIRNRTAQMVKAPQEALAQSYDGHSRNLWIQTVEKHPYSTS